MPIQVQAKTRGRLATTNLSRTRKTAMPIERTDQKQVGTGSEERLNRLQIERKDEAGSIASDVCEQVTERRSIMNRTFRKVTEEKVPENEIEGQTEKIDP